MASTGWPAVRDKCRDLGITFQLWQDGAGRVILAKRADGKYAASVGGVVISIPRQVGKTFLLGGVVFALCLLFPNLTVLWTAHRLRTANETFTSMQGFARRKKIKPYVMKIVLGSGEEEIRFKNGSRILFGARERGFGLGFAKVDVLVFDEAQRLTEAAIDDMVPATNQSRQPAGALLLFTGTPPRPADPGEVFRRKRAECLSGEDEDTAYIEFSADRDASPDDWRQVAKANPSYPKYTPREAIKRMRKNLGIESYMREGLGIWDEDLTGKPINPSIWAALAKPHLLESRPNDLVPVFFVHVAPDSTASAIAVAYPTDEGRPFVELPDYRPGTAWLVQRCAELDESHPGGTWAVEAAGAVGALLPALEDEGIAPEEFSARGMGQACAYVQQLVADRAVWHSGDAAFAIAVQGAEVRPVGEGLWVFSPRKSSVDVSPLTAAAGALWTLEQFNANYDVLDSVSGG